MDANFRSQMIFLIMNLQFKSPESQHTRNSQENTKKELLIKSKGKRKSKAAPSESIFIEMVEIRERVPKMSISKDDSSTFRELIAQFRLQF